MATVRLNVALESIHGKVGDKLYRQYPHKLVIGPLPDYSKRKRNANQKASSSRFADAQGLTTALLADPQLKPAIERCARRGRMKPHDYLMRYLLKEHKPGQPFPWDAASSIKPATKGNVEN
jgi:hypothetical protein